MKNISYFMITLIYVVLFSFSYAWNDLITPIAICTANGEQSYPSVISDRKEGAIITWTDTRNNNQDIYIQSIDSSGKTIWVINGIQLTTNVRNQFYPSIIPDGIGGAILSWTDDRNSNYDIYAQAIDSTGSIKWTAGGVAICTVKGIQYNPIVVSNGDGGAILTWQDCQDSGYYEVFAQAIDSMGNIKWSPNGVLIYSQSTSENHPRVVSDNQGGAIITWQDDRNGNMDIYAQGIDSKGTIKWTINGVAICTTIGDQNYPSHLISPATNNIVSNGKGGAIISWQDRSSGVNNIYLQAVDSTGNIYWQPEGIPVCTDTSEKESPSMVSDEQGGVILAWDDYRSRNNPLQGEDLYTQAIDSIGNYKWIESGVAISTSGNIQISSSITSDGENGAIITWMDFSGGFSNVSIQAINKRGHTKWHPNGINISNNVGFFVFSPTIASDGKGGAFVTWYDQYSDIFMQRVSADDPTFIKNWLEYRIYE